MICKIWHKFFLLTVLSFLPLLSQAQCITTAGINQNGTVTKTLTSSGDTVVSVPFKFVIQQTPCFVMATPLSPVGTSTNEPLTITKNGVTVNFNDSALGIPKGGCSSDPKPTVINFFNCSFLPIENTVVIQYTLKGKSTTTDPNIKFFDAKLTGFPTPASTTGAVTAAGIPVNVPASTPSTCSFLIDPPNIKLDTIKLSDIQNLASGVAVTSGQKTFNINVTCQNNAFSSDRLTFVPQFSPTKSAVLTGNNHIALNDATDNGAGFKLFDSSGTALDFNKLLSDFLNSQFRLTQDELTVTRTFTVKYVKTSKAVTSGPVTSTIMVTFSIL